VRGRDVGDDVVVTVSFVKLIIVTRFVSIKGGLLGMQ